MGVFIYEFHIYFLYYIFHALQEHWKYSWGIFLLENINRQMKWRVDYTCFAYCTALFARWRYDLGLLQVIRSFSNNMCLQSSVDYAKIWPCYSEWRMHMPRRQLQDLFGGKCAWRHMDWSHKVWRNKYCNNVRSLLKNSEWGMAAVTKAKESEGK